MPRREPPPLPTSLPFWVAFVASAVLVAQLIIGRDPLGLVGLATLIVPGIALTAALGASGASRPERLLAAVSLSLALTVLTGVVAALSPQGLDARSVAVVELGILGASFLAWLVRRWENRRRTKRVAAPAANRAGGTGRGHRLVGVGAGTAGLVVLGLLLGGAGYAVAARTAQTQDYGGFVQFWSTPPEPGRPPEVSVVNQTNFTLACSIEVARPGRGGASVFIDALAPGQPWVAQLPSADPGETAAWQLGLRCTGAPDPIERRLRIDPPRSGGS